MTFARFAESIRQFGEQEWDSVAGAELMMSHRWHRVMESSRVGFRPRYALIEDARGPLAAVATAGRTPLVVPGSWQERIASMLTLTIGAPFSARASGIAVRSDVSLAAVLPAVEPALARLCLIERRPLLGVTNVREGEVDTFRARGFKAVPRPPTMVIDLAGATYDEYLRQLAKDDRAEVRRARRRAAEHRTELSCVPVSEATKALYPLFLELCAYHRTRPPVTADFFAALAAEMPTESRVVSGSIDGQPAGFVLCLTNGDSLIAPMIGLNYELSRPSCLYQVMIDEMVRWSLQHGIRHVQLGLTNERQKRRHGFRAQARYACVRTPMTFRGLRSLLLPAPRGCAALRDEKEKQNHGRNQNSCMSWDSVDTTIPLPRS